MRRRSLLFSSVATLMLAPSLLAQPVAAPPAASQAGAPPPAQPAIKSPVVADDGRVTVRFRAPEAKEVILNLLGRHPMQKDAQGIWSVTTDPMAPDIYPYSVIVDGVGLADPNNPGFAPSFVRAPGSIVHVPGPASLPWELNADVPHGVVAHHWYKSAAIGDTRDFYVYTPAGFDASGKTEYPVLFLLHGLTEEASAWMTTGRANIILDNLISQGQARPMVVVSTFGYGLPVKELVDRPSMAGPHSKANFTRAVIEEVLPMVERLYHVSKDSQLHAIAGLSMGGATSFFIGLNHLEAFAWVAGLSSALVEYSIGEPDVNGRAAPVTDATFARVFPKLDASIDARLRLLWISCGTEDGLLAVNRQFSAWLKGKNVTVRHLETPGAHTWLVWRRNLAELAPLLFKAGK